MATDVTPPHQHGHFHRIGRWLPDNSKILLDWVRKFVKKVDDDEACWDPEQWPVPVQNLRNLIERNTTRLRMLASAMFDEVPTKPPYDKDPVGNKQVRNYKHMLQLFACIATNLAPEWSETEYGVGLIGFPFNAILDWPMATPSGYAFFLEPEVNEIFKDILNHWKDTVLTTDKSLYVLTEDSNGWLSEEARTTIMQDTNVDGGQDPPFEKVFLCNKTADHWNFTSWDNFFVREFRDIDEYRPVDHKEDPKWIVNACESKPFARQEEVREHDTFWLKGQPYSVAEMVNNDPKGADFIGGTVYQAFLSATSYHRWNSPVKGIVTSAYVIDGTYFSEPTITGFWNPDGPDPAAPDQAQGYITHVATRAVFFIQADDEVGPMCVIFVGMADVSTCEIKEKFRGQNISVPVEKGEELGMFHHGGSTHALLFRKGLKLSWVPTSDPGTAERNLPIRSELAVVESDTD